MFVLDSVDSYVMLLGDYPVALEDSERLLDVNSELDLAALFEPRLMGLKQWDWAEIALQEI